MAKQPYIKFWTGDWLRDTQLLSNAAKGFWIDLLCHLHDSAKTGVLTLDLTELSRVSRENLSSTESLLEELRRRNICDIEKLDGGLLQITSRRMVRDAAERDRKSAAGKVGGRNLQDKLRGSGANSQDKNNNSALTDAKAKTETECGIGIGNNNSNNEGGGTGEETNLLQSILNGEETREDVIRDVWVGYTQNSILSIEHCAVVYLYSTVSVEQRRILAINRKHFYQEGVGVRMDMVRRWLGAFLMHLYKKGDTEVRTHAEFASYFFNWTGTQDLTKEPEKIYEKPTGNYTASKSAYNGGYGGKNGSPVSELQGLKRGVTANPEERTGFTTVEVVEG